jgi:hypothetical protein
MNSEKVRFCVFSISGNYSNFQEFELEISDVELLNQPIYCN